MNYLILIILVKSNNNWDVPVFAVLLLFQCSPSPLCIQAKGPTQESPFWSHPSCCCSSKSMNQNFKSHDLKESMRNMRKCLYYLHYPNDLAETWRYTWDSRGIAIHLCFWTCHLPRWHSMLEKHTQALDGLHSDPSSTTYRFIFPKIFNLLFFFKSRMTVNSKVLKTNTLGSADEGQCSLSVTSLCSCCCICTLFSLLLCLPQALDFSWDLISSGKLLLPSKV